jgi:hypothetical protein
MHDDTMPPTSDRIDEAKPEADVEEQQRPAFDEDTVDRAHEAGSVAGVEADAADVADQLIEVPIEDDPIEDEDDADEF